MVDGGDVVARVKLGVQLETKEQVAVKIIERNKIQVSDIIFLLATTFEWWRSPVCINMVET